jgi:uncharacterized protein YukE
MTDLGAIEEDVRFAWDAATALAADLRATAGGLEGQVPRRNSLADTAKEEWRGVYAGKFTGRMSICTSDAGRVASAMRDAAEKLDELAVLAHEEQERRELARAWKVEHDAWQRREDDKGMFESFTDGVGITDYDEPVCPVGPPATEPRRTIPAPVPAAREN